MTTLKIGEFTDINLSQLTEIRQDLFLVKILVFTCLSAVSVTLILSFKDIISLSAMFFLGLMYTHAAVLEHRCVHNTAFHSKQWNRIIGFLLGLPMLVSFSDYQDSHLRHHKLLGSSEDKEFFNYDCGSLKSPKILIPLLLLPHYRHVAVRLYKTIKGEDLEVFNTISNAEVKIRDEYRLMTLFLFSILAITIGFQTTIFLKIWLIPLIFASPTYALIELPEHIGCERSVADVAVNTRTITASKLAVWFTDGNNYHVEHHWLPNIPGDRLAELHSYIKPKIRYLDSSYLSFYTKFIRNIFREQVFIPEAWLPEKAQIETK
ncbi:fatty acid desaturase [Chlorogloeopsis sp. ULAP01]|uniref:fatty acid desaturase n=1 Tax=Chlorogloeopsis sp. ULAP01 TaxID=3056483 RepID=UPI0025AAC9F2|nr:fatty acid desaturase [Chlorogloeopsis sp. ULAP01]MDM9382648.1 fatty acid desaturase [Chlorogloeopsis sp. ULAP01]